MLAAGGALTRSGATLALAVLAACGPAWPSSGAAPASDVEPPVPPLALVGRQVIDEASAPIWWAELATDDERVFVAWAQGARAYWAELDRDARPRWRRELPFVPAHFGVVGGRAVFVVIDGGVRVCAAPSLRCELVSPEGRVRVSFGPSELALDFGAAVVRYAPADGGRAIERLPAALYRHAVQLDVRVAPCGEAWVVLGEEHVYRLGGGRLAPVERGSALAIAGSRSFALSRDGTSALDLCSGRSLPAASAPGSMAIAAFIGARGLAILRAWSSHDGGRSDHYDHGGRSEPLYRSVDFDPRAPHVAAAHVDRRARLWLVVIEGHTLSVELRESSR